MAVSFTDFAFKNMFWLANALWILVSTFVLRLLSLDCNQRSQINGDGGGDDVGESENNPDDRNSFAAEIFRLDSGFKSLCEEENSFDSLGASNSTTSKYEFVAGNSFCGYIEQPLNTSFKVHELFLDSSFEDGVTKISSVAIEQSVPRDLQDFNDHRETGESLVDQEVEEEAKSGLTELVLCSAQSADKDFSEIEIDDQVKIEIPVVKDSEEVVDQKKIGVFDCDEVSSDESNHKGVLEGSDCDEPSFEEEREIKSGVVNVLPLVLSDSEEIVHSQDCIPGRIEQESIDIDPDEQSDEVGSPRENHLRFSFNHVSQKPSGLTNDFWHTNGKFIADFDEFYCYQGSTKEALAPETPTCVDAKSVDPYEEDFSDSISADSDDDEHQGSVMNLREKEDYCEKSGQLETEKSSNRVLDEDDEIDVDVLLEHQSYVQKMKKDIRHLRTIGLPTIMEDSESPRLDDDLKPLKINEKVGYKDRLDEIQRFYKTYLDKMRKLDILCHQTMYAVGFLQLKNPDQLAANKKLTLPSIKSLLAHNLLANKFRRNESDPVRKLIRDLQKDLELVYVGQICLSWEILKWQHAKAEELQLFDTTGLRQYGLVAGEFQQLQVLMQRFTEDEPFQGPRIENYVKSRCANCSFLQVPPIKDGSKNGEGKTVVSIVRLTDVIEESMHAFWEFIRTDKKEAGNVGVRDPLDAELLSDIRANLAKKERRLKDLVRSGNCIVKKFQKHPERRLTLELLLAQVEIKIVMRVIKMSSLTSDQLLWCHKKLSKISIVGRKAHIESSFSLFPC